MTDTGNTDKTLVMLSRYLGVKKRLHHLTVHKNGRCLIRASVIRRLHLEPFVSVSAEVHEDTAYITLYRDGRGTMKIVNPVTRSGIRSSCAYFYCKRIARKASAGRLRFIGKGQPQPDGSFRIRLSLYPVRDLQYMLTKK